MDAGEEQVIAHIGAAAASRGDVARLILFGSRATRNHRPRSDFDIAVQADNMSYQDWATFVGDLQESVPTLCGLDLIKLDGTTSASLRDAINQTGLIFFADGVDTTGPKDVLTKAFQLGYIDDEALWLAMIQDRNNAAHLYDEQAARAIVDRVKAQYINLVDTTFDA